MSRHVRPLLALLGLLLVAGCERSSPPAASAAPAPARRYFGGKPDGKLHVYFFDVGQGDATLIISPTGRTVLVDAGPRDAGAHLANRLPELLTEKLDLVVLTHPHPEHHGGLGAAVGAVGAKKLLEPQLPGNSPDYDALLTSLAGHGVETFSPSASGEPLSLPLGGGAELAVLWPRVPTEPLLPGAPDEGHNSIILRLTHGSTSVLLAGDARASTEARLLSRKVGLHATLLKVGAHGADSASSAAFLEAVRPQAAILSTREGRTPGTPSSAALARLEKVGARLFRTDRDGEVHAVSDGERITLIPQRLPEGSEAGSTSVYPGQGDSPAPLPSASAVQPASGQVKEDLSRYGKVLEFGKPLAEQEQKADIDLDDDSPAPSTPRVSRVERHERPAAPAAVGKVRYVASRKRKLFHQADCRAVKRISKENLIVFTSREEAARGRTPARDCDP